MSLLKNFFVVSLLILIACNENESHKKSNLSKRKIQVVTTTGMIADAVRNVGGTRVDVISLMGPGVDPHLYKASEGDVSRMMNADLICYNGLHLEGKMAEIFEKMQRQVKTVAVSDHIDRDRLLSPAGYQGTYDPHIWFDVKMWIKVVEYIGQILMDLDSIHAEFYQQNFSHYVDELSKLDAYVLAQSEKVERSKRVLITAHDAFNYFGRAYGFEVRGLQGISTVTEAGTGDVQDLAEFILNRQIPAIFVETSVPVRYIEALQAAVKSRGFNVKIGGNLFSDAMGDMETPQGKYTGMIRHNIDTIVKAFVQ
jgi:manganese/zinc/iron transport system substrate-binding protein